MSRVKVKINLRGVNELMKSKEIQAHLSHAAECVARYCGPGYEHKGYVINWIALENIYPITAKDAIDNTKNNTLIKALSFGGLPLKKGK